MAAFVRTNYLRPYPPKTVAAGTIRFFGDSFTAGNGASDAAHSYVSLLQQAAEWSGTNLGVGGRQATQVAASDIYPLTIIDGDISTLLVGYNNARHLGSDAVGLTTYEQTLRACVARLAIPHARWKHGADNSITFSGSDWTSASSTYSGKVNSKYTQTNGATATQTLYGAAIYISYTCRKNLGGGDGGSFTVTVDGTVYATVDTNSAALDDGPPSFWPHVVRIGGLAPGAHTVVVTAISNGSQFVQIEGYATNNGPTSNAPRVYVGTIPVMNTLGYALGSPTYSNATDAIIDSYNRVLRRVVTDFSADGLLVTLAEVSQAYNPWDGITSQTDENIHPNDLGHSRIAQAFLAAVNNAPTLRERSPFGDVGDVGRAVARARTALESRTAIFASLPTADPHVSGQLWNNSGTLKVSAG
jgi:lysophospholipase L1-like esterase